MLYLLHQTVTRAAQRGPDRDAVRMAGRSLTWAELEQESNRLSHMLAEQGVRRGDRVGICARKSVDVAVAMHGVMKAGAAYVPMNPDAPAASLLRILRDCGVRHLVSEPAKGDMVRALSRDTDLEMCIGTAAIDDCAVRCVDWDEVAAMPGDSPAPVSLTEQDLAYIICTSGSTGQPKGITHSHRSALSFAEVAAKTYGLGPDDRITNHAPIHFDLSTLDYFATAVAGGTTIIVPEAHTRFPASLSQLLEEERVTVLYAVPFALIQLLLRGALPKRDLGALRWVLFGGEPFPTKHLRALMGLLPHARFSNVYGPTETNGCTYYIVRPIAPDSNEAIPIGCVYENVEAIVVDGEDRPVGPDGTGELLIRSPTRMRGYWGQPALTERATFRRRNDSGDDDLFHRTGDLVRVGRDGNFRLIGRMDRQIKTRGHRVELDEIEAALVAHGAVEEAAVYTVPDLEGSRSILAAVTLRTNGGAPDDEAAIRAVLLGHLRAQLPPYAVPSRLDVLQAFPRTSTGKIDRNALEAGARLEPGGG